MRTGHAMTQLVETPRYKPEGRGFDSFRPLFDPGVDSAFNRNEYEEHFLGGNDGQCVRLTTLQSLCADYHEILEPQPPGTLRSCPDL